MNTSNKYYVVYNNQQHGPISWHELVRNYPTNALIWTEGMDKWQPLSTVMPQQPVPPTSTPPPPPPTSTSPKMASSFNIDLLLKDRKAGMAVTIIGAMLLTFSIIQYTANQPKMFASSVGDWVRTFAENVHKEKKRKQATRVMIMGGVFVAVGSVLLLKSKKSNVVNSMENSNHK